MSSEVAIAAILHPAPGKLERFREFIADLIAWIQTNEPETLEFNVYEEQISSAPDSENVRVFLFERYASAEALHKHESSAHYAEVFQTMADEAMLSGPPTIVKGGPLSGFRR